MRLRKGDRGHPALPGDCQSRCGGSVVTTDPLVNQGEAAARKIVVHTTPELDAIEGLIVDWLAYEGIPEAIQRLVERRRLPSHHIAQLEQTWAQVLDLLWSVRPGERPRVLLGAQDRDGVRDRHGLATVYPGSRGPGAVTGNDDAKRARIAVNRLGLPPVVQVRSPLTGEVVLSLAKTSSDSP
jgi:hypothetical protein